MDHRLRMEIRLGFAAEDGLDFGSQQPSCPSSARSFSSTSSSDPYTPTSGRSTPHQAPPGSMANFDPVTCSSSSMAYELTPPASDLESYFPMEIKSEYPPAFSNCTTMMRTPGEKYEPGMSMALHQMPDSLFHGMYPVEPTNSQPLPQYSFPVQHMRHHPPSSLSSGSYILPSSEFDTFQTWNGEPESFHGDFYPRPAAASMVPMEQLDVPMPEGSPRSSGSLSSHGKRCVKQVQQKTKNPRRAQSKQSKPPGAATYDDDDNWSNGEGNFHIAEKAQYFCQWMDCQKSFRRLEHLKRHSDTVHDRFKVFTCHFCPPQKGPKVFNRFDNYRSHVILHTKRPSTSAKRTNYHPAAAAHLAALEAQMKVRTKKRTASPSTASTATAAASGAAATESPPGAAEKQPSPTPSAPSTPAYTPGSSRSGGSDETASVAAARHGLGRLDLEAYELVPAPRQ